MNEALNPAEEPINPLENPKDKESGNKNSEKINKDNLTKQEVRDLENEKTTRTKLVQERQRYEQAAKAEMQALLRLEKSNETINLNEYKELKKECENLEKEMDETQSPEKMKAILEKIKDIPRQREEAKKNKEKKDKEKSKKLDIDSPELKELQKDFDKICDDNANLIGTKQVLGFKKWFELELKKNPTIKHAQETIDRLEGKKVYDKGGLAPRKEIFKELERLFERYEAGSTLNSEYIKAEGLTERQEFLREAKNAESEVKRGNDSFWSSKAKNKTMQQVLSAKSPHEMKKLTIQIKQINAIESEGFVYMKNTMQIKGISMRKMSDASIAKFLKGLTNEGDLKKRMNYITGNGKYTNGIKEAVENEGSLANKEVNPQTASIFGIKEGLEGIYEEKPDELKIAIKSFETLNFIQKIEALKEHKALVEKAKSKEDLEKTLTIKAAHAKIDEAARKKIVSNDTREKYKEWFSNQDNYKDPKTGKPGNMETLKKYFEILTNPTPDPKARNLSAYEIKHDRFKKEVEELKKINPDTDKEELRKWQEKYDKEGWTLRKQIYKDLKKEQAKLTEKQKKKKETETKVEITKEDKDKEKSKDLSKKEVIQSSISLINEDQAAEALKKLIAYNDENPDDADIIFWMEVALKRIKEFGSGKKLEDSEKKQIEEEVEKVAESDEAIKYQMEEENLTTLNLEGAQMSEDRHQRKISGQERAEKESVSQTQDGSLEKELTKDFYEQTDREHILNKEGTGEEITEIKFDDIAMTDPERRKLKEKTHKKESRLFNKEGFTHVKLTDKSGREISAQEAKTEQKKNIEELEDKIAKKALEKTKTKSGKEAKGNVYDLNARIAAKRKAKELVEEDVHSHDRLRTA